MSSIRVLSSSLLASGLLETYMQSFACPSDEAETYDFFVQDFFSLGKSLTFLAEIFSRAFEVLFVDNMKQKTTTRSTTTAATTTRQHGNRHKILHLIKRHFRSDP
jgi:hypothetical protein